VYLLDTDVVSELRKPKPHQGAVRRWAQLTQRFGVPTINPFTKRAPPDGYGRGGKLGLYLANLFRKMK
jgi:hypothetical protein